MMNKKQVIKKIEKNKRAMTQLKAYFLIINMIIAIVAFGWMVSAEGESAPAAGAPSILQVISSAFGLGKQPSNTPQPAAKSTAPGIGSYVDGQKFRIAANAQPPTVTGVNPIGGTGPTNLPKVIGGKILPDGNYQVDYGGGKNAILNPTEGKATMDQIGATESKSVTRLGGTAVLNNLLTVGAMFGIGYLIGGFIGGNADLALGLALAGGTLVYQIGSGQWGGGGFSHAGLWGIGIGAAIFLFMYEKTSTEIVEFNCLPYQPPIGGQDCEKCNDFEQCSEYSCKSLGQACQLLNAGTGEESCDWVNPHDVNSPRIQISDVLKGYKWVPDTAVRPPATGAVISQENGNCVKAFTPLEFVISADEPSQCKIDYNLTKGFDEMSYYIGGSNLFSYNHTEKMSLPSPSAVNAVDPQLKNDGTYTLYVRCRDANGNFNQDAYSIRFCVEKGPDTTPPRIDGLSIPSNSPISYNTTSLYLEVYVNEPAECKWSREDRDFSQMETNMSCDTNLWEINSNNVYTCKTTLTGIKDRQNNEYYFRCKDQPNAPGSERNPNVQSYLYNVVGTQPLNILSISPDNETIKDSTDTIAINLEVKTDNGYKNGEAFCYYTDTQTTDRTIVNKICMGEEDTYIMFAETGNRSTHTQKQNLITGDYTYYIKCVDLGGNAAYDCTKFYVEVDRSAPIIVRAYKESGQLKVMTDERADCSYSNKDCNFEIEDGIKMSTLDNTAHNAEWLITKNYYIRCADVYNNQPNPNTCSVVIRPYQFVDKSDVIEL